MERAEANSQGSFRVSAMLVRSLAGELQQLGIAPETLLGEAINLLDGEQSFVPLWHYRALLARAVELTGDPALGLRCGLQASESSFGLISPLITHAPTLRHGISLVMQFQPLLLEGVRLRLVEQGARARVQCQFIADEAARDRSLIELIMGGLVRTLRQFGCRRDEILAVRFAYPCPAHHPAYADAFFGLCQFSRSTSEVEFSANALDRHNVHRHPQLHALMLAEAERNLEQRTRNLSWTEQVQTCLRSQSLKRLPDLVAAAHLLGLSPRTLRRRLDQEGSSYRQLTQALLYESACSLLRNPALTLQHIADALGFSDVTAFHRAFRRWSGKSPAHYRDALRAPIAIDIPRSSEPAHR